MLDQKDVFIFAITPSAAPTSGLESEWTVPSNLPYLQGHFPSQAVLPAVAMIDASLELLRRALELEEIPAYTIANAKFMVPVIPELKLKIKLQPLTLDTWQANWETLNPENQSILLAKMTIILNPKHGFSS